MLAGRGEWNRDGGAPRWTGRRIVGHGGENQMGNEKCEMLSGFEPFDVVQISHVVT